jgi:hypothetical protein
LGIGDFAHLAGGIKPLIYQYSSAPEKVAHVYNPEYAPDHVVYMLVLKTCTRSNSKKQMDIALYAYECAKEQNIAFTGSMYTGLLRCIAECEDEEC